MINSFTTTMAMDPSSVSLPNNYGQSAPGYGGTQVTTTSVTLTGNDLQPYTAALPTVFDTGGGDDNIIYQDQTGTNAVPAAYIEHGANSGPVISHVDLIILSTHSRPAKYPPSTGRSWMGT
jgi:hypothetical protein